MNLSILYLCQLSGEVISTNCLEFFSVSIFSSIFVGFSRNLTTLPKISQAQVAQLTHFIFEASLLPAQTQII